MSTAKRLVTTTAAILLFVSIVCAQEQNPASSSRSTITVTAAAAGDRVRFTAPSTVVQMRIEVYASNGEKLFDNEIRGGNVIDWHLQDGRAERLSDGSYLCVITTKSLSGRMSQKLGKITIADAASSIHPIDSTHLTAQQTQAVGPLKENASLTVLTEGKTQTATVIGHNGEEGQITRGRGALSFRVGDFYSGKDTEQMRLTAEGNLGIGFTHPQAKLDVDGLIRTSEGIVFPDGTIQTTAGIGRSSDQTRVGNPLGGKLPKSTGEHQASGKAGKSDGTFSPQFSVDEDLTVNGNIIFTPSFFRDIAMQNNNGGLRFYGAPVLTNSPGAAAIQFWGNNSGFPGQAFIDSGATNAAAVIIRTAVTGGTIAERMRVTATGNVGIGTSAPNHLLTVGSIETPVITSAILGIYGANSSYVIARDRNHDVEALFGADNTSVGGTNGASLYGSVTNHGVDFRTNNASRMVITPKGDVGIGTTTPAHSLTIGTGTNTNVTTADLAVFGASGAYATVRDTTNNVQALFGADSTTVGGVIGTSIYGSTTNHGVQFRTDNNTRMAITPAGNVGIGTNDPAAKLDVVGDIRFAPRTAYYSVSPTAFNPEVEGYAFSQQGGFIHPKPFPGFNQHWSAPVNLPDGAIMTEFRVLIDEDDDTQNVEINLFRVPQDYEYTQPEKLASITSNTTSSSNPTKKFYTDATIDSPVIDNSTYTYSVYFLVNSDKFAIGAVRIKYTYTHP
ncbi:MAG: hypothetical protein AABO57_05345 [Acidobacteriota bacterium]